MLLTKDAAGKYHLDYEVNSGIYLGLKRDRDAARRLLEGVLAKDRTNRTARAALDALEAVRPLPSDPVLTEIIRQGMLPRPSRSSLPRVSPTLPVENAIVRPQGPGPVLGAGEGR